MGLPSKSSTRATTNIGYSPLVGSTNPLWARVGTQKHRHRYPNKPKTPTWEPKGNVFMKETTFNDYRHVAHASLTKSH